MKRMSKLRYRDWNGEMKELLLWLIVMTLFSCTFISAVIAVSCVAGFKTVGNIAAIVFLSLCCFFFIFCLVVGWLEFHKEHRQRVKELEGRKNSNFFHE